METFLSLLESILPVEVLSLIKTTALTPAQEALVIKACLDLLKLVLSNAPTMLQNSTDLLAGLADTISKGLGLEDSTEEAPNEQTIALYSHADLLGKYAVAIDESILNIRELVESYADTDDAGIPS
jgi:hypothetical protein